MKIKSFLRNSTLTLVALSLIIFSSIASARKYHNVSYGSTRSIGCIDLQTTKRSWCTTKVRFYTKGSWITYFANVGKLVKDKGGQGYYQDAGGSLKLFCNGKQVKFTRLNRSKGLVELKIKAPKSCQYKIKVAGYKYGKTSVSVEAGFVVQK